MRESQLSLRDRSMITIAALFSAGLCSQLKSHLILGKEHGVTKVEAIEIATQLAFYCGWPKAWSTFPMIVELVSSGNLPKRLPLGSDAVRIIRDELKSHLAEVEKTESYSITTDY